MEITPRTLGTVGVDWDTAVSFLEYHNERPHVWRLFEKLALEKISKKEFVSGKSIAEDMRRVENLPDHTGAKVANEWVSTYVRVFVLKYPEHKHLFKLNQLFGVKKAA